MVLADRGAPELAAAAAALAVAGCWRCQRRGGWRWAEPPLVSATDHHKDWPSLPTLERAQRTSVVRVPGFLSAADIEAIHRAADQENDDNPQLVSPRPPPPGPRTRWLATLP